MSSLFYYPKINPPKSVVYQALLYWDRLVTVAPPGSLEDFLDPRMREVHAAGLYRRLTADRWPRPGASLARSLLLLTHLLDQIPADDLIPPRDGPASYVHTAKLAFEIRDELERRGLSQGITLSGARIHVSAATQLALISVAARDIAAQFGGPGGMHGENSLYPYTDSPAAHLFAHAPFASGYWPESDRRTGANQRLDHVDYYGRPRTVPCWEVQIGGLLPVPGNDVLIGDLIAFRERYADERRRLMLAIDLLVHGLQRHYDHPQDVLNMVRHELESALADLKAAGHAARITWLQRSLMASIALAAGYAGQKILPEAGWILGVIGGTAINVATNQTRPSDYGPTGDFTYLYRINSALE
ncbi:hypothetical protein ACFYYL_43745 [Actinomadura geliboluensis]|uniref:hypothetical protein n=1 Tax=Actinomadura geliboluensis TaxID=882440 RepID=UPI0036C53DD7